MLGKKVVHKNFQEIRVTEKCHILSFSIGKNIASEIKKVLLK